MNYSCENLESISGDIYLYGFSALDRYYGIGPGIVSYIATTASLVDLARGFDDVIYPGRYDADVLLSRGLETCLFKSIESLEDIPVSPAAPLSFLYNIKRESYLDRFMVYPDLRSCSFREGFSFTANGPEKNLWLIYSEIAVLISRYNFAPPDLWKAAQASPEEEDLLSPDEQREILLLILTGKNQERGLKFLMDCGFIKAHWPQLALLNQVDHSKEFHPEGNVWQHTLETFTYMKDQDVLVALALLLHDTGKPLAEETEGRRFDRHAQIGGKEAKRFLRKLNFPQDTVEDVWFLVYNHMLPAFIPDIPHFRTEKVLSSPLFPQLLEVYRCDLSSTFQGPDGYYRACKAYKQYLKNVKNPYRDVSGNKRLRNEFLYSS